MNKYKYKIKNILNERKNVLIFFLVILFIGIIFGSFFITILDELDKKQVVDQLTNFFSSDFKMSINILKSSLISNISIILFIWILGASGIGLIFIPIVIFIKGFILGFSIGAICYTYGIKGIIISFIYIFPHDLITLFVIFLLCVKSFNLSLNFLKSIIGRKQIDYRLFGKRYLRLLVILLLFSICASFLETYLSPMLINIIKPLF